MDEKLWINAYMMKKLKRIEQNLKIADQEISIISYYQHFWTFLSYKAYPFWQKY